jgi:Na+/melibiose symporter-like transporter
MTETASDSDDRVSSAFSGRVPRRLKLFYSVGAAAEAIIGVAFNAFNFFFYTNVLGIPGTLAGLAITIALVFDAVTDPLVGAISDRWRSRLGRRHPFMFCAPIPVMACLFLIYSPPEGWNDFGLFAWLTVLTVTMRSTMTLFHVPHLALGAELSADFTERTRVMSMNTLLGAFGGFGIAFVAYSLFFAATPEYPNGLLNQAAYPMFAMYAALAGGSIMLASTILTMSVIPKLPRNLASVGRFSPKTFISDMKSALSNRNYLMLLIGLTLVSALLGTRETIALHLNTYFWELLPEQIRYFIVFAFIAPIVGFLITARLHETFEKKPVMIGCVAGTVIFSSAPIVLRILGWFPENHSPALMPTLIIFYVLYATLILMASITAMSILADVADEHELNTGRRQEGIFYSARSFFAKASSGFGHLVAGIAIDVIEFPVGAQPGTVDAGKLFDLGMVDGPIAAIPGIIAVFFYARISLTRKRHAEIQTALAANRVHEG